MRSGGVGAVRELFDAGTLVGLDDAQLLDRFVGGRGEPAERAFEMLVRRHGPVVALVCRRALRDDHAAQDAFQATFLVLARTAGSIRRPEALASWLHGVARRVARQSRRADDRRRRAELRAATSRQPEPMPNHPAGDFEALHAEIDRLPGRYREAIVLCDLAGLTHEAAARQLGCPPGTLSARVARGRARLRAALIRRGVGDPGLVPLAGKLAPELPDPLVAATVRAAMSRMTVAGVVPAAAEALAGGMVMTMRFDKLLTVGFGLMVGAVGLGALALAATGGTDDPKPPAPIPPHAAPPVERADRNDAAALVRSAREQEAWIGRVDSLWLKADVATDPGPAGIARKRRELQAQFPGRDIDAEVKAKHRDLAQIEVAFDRKRFRSQNRYSWGNVDTRVWDGTRYLGGWVDNEDPEKTGYLLLPKPAGALDGAWSFFTSFRAGPHPTWWISAAGRYPAADFATPPEEFVAVGRDRFDGVECDVACAWGTWRRFYVAAGRLRGIKEGCQARPDFLERQAAYLRQGGYEIGDAEAFFAGLSPERRRAVDRKLAQGMLTLTEPIFEHGLEDYREIAPGCWLPFRQTTKTLILDEAGHNAVDFTLTTTLTLARVNEPLPDALFDVPIPDGATVVDQTSNPPLTYRQQASRTTAK